jgi:hypothetical protein
MYLSMDKGVLEMVSVSVILMPMLEDIQATLIMQQDLVLVILVGDHK